MTRWNPSPVASAERLATLLLLGVYVVWMLSLPAWPSQDGPVHLFFTQVFADLLSHTGSVYSQFFFIKHLLPPYALYYYLLLLLSHIVPLLLADRLVICLYLVLFLTGFHALAQGIAPANPKGADRATLLASLLLLNWPLGMGFVNYCLSLALALWALAVWFRPPASAPLRRAVLFLVLVVAITLAHPVPLLIVLGITALDLLTRPFRHRTGPRPAGKTDILTFALATLPLLYVKAFAAQHLLAQRTVEIGTRQRAVQRIAGYAQGKSLSLLFGHSIAVDLYRTALFLTLLFALAAAAFQFLHNRRHALFTVCDLFLAASVALLILLPWLPSDISGAYYFPERLILLIWIFALLAAAGWQPRPGRNPGLNSSVTSWLAPALIAFAFAAALALVLSANTALRPLATQSRAWEDSPLIRPGELVLSLESSPLPPAKRILPSWEPHYWMVANTIRSRGAVLANAPWLDSSIIPLGATGKLPASQLSPQIANSPGALTALLRKNPGLAAHLVPSAPAISFTPAEAQPTGVPDRLLLSTGSPAASWICLKTLDQGDQVCRHGP